MKKVTNKEYYTQAAEFLLSLGDSVQFDNYWESVTETLFKRYKTALSICFVICNVKDKDLSGLDFYINRHLSDEKNSLKMILTSEIKDLSTVSYLIRVSRLSLIKKLSTDLAMFFFSIKTKNKSNPIPSEEKNIIIKLLEDLLHAEEDFYESKDSRRGE